MNEFKRNFYNPAKKQKYINTCPENRRILIEKIFTVAQPLEEQKEKDLCDFDRDECLELYSYFNAKTPSSLRNIHCMVCNYKTACGSLDEEVTRISSGILRTKINKAAVRSKLITREELLHAISISEENPVFNPSDAFIALAYFEGVDEVGSTNIYNMHIQDFFLDYGQYYVQLHSGRTIRASHELYHYALRSSELGYRFSEYKGISVRKQPIEAERGAIIKYTVRKDNQADLITPIEARRKKTVLLYLKAGLSLTNLPKSITKGKDLRIAGFVDAIKEGCKNTHTDWEEFLSNNKDEIMNQYGFTRLTDVKNILRDYMNI